MEEVWGKQLALALESEGQHSPITLSIHTFTLMN
jgi:hypothetical protein